MAHGALPRVVAKVGILGSPIMQISLEHIDDAPTPSTFRVAFHSAADRWLLPYPCVTGLTFTDTVGNPAPEWVTRELRTEPLDDFVLTPGARIAFDLHANINGIRRVDRWSIELMSGEYLVHFGYRVDRDTEWYDYLAKRSRFAAMTRVWRGEVRSNVVRYAVV